jgi:hypothetical protein
MKTFLAALGLFTCAVCTVTTAEGALIASASVDGGGTIFAIDNDLTSTCGSPVVGPCQLPDIDPTLNRLVVGAHTIGGNLLVLPTVQTADVATGAGTFNRLDSTGTQFTNNDTVSHAVSVAIGATDFFGPSTVAFTTGAGQFSTLGPGGFGDTTITQRWFNDPLNEQGALTPGAVQPGSLIDLFTFAPTQNPQSFSHNGGPFAVNDPSLFSMTLQFDTVIGPGVRLTGREQTEIKPFAVVSAPGAGLLMGLGALLVGWRRTRG